MGGPGQPSSGAVVTGPVAGWDLVRNAFNIFGFPGTGGTISSFMANPNYTAFRQVEGPHGAAHVWVGGFVGNAIIAPRDPVFWLIHANVDRLWSEWIDQHASAAGFQPYLPLSGAVQGHNFNDTMWPWNGTAAPFGMLPWTVVPEAVRPADLTDHRALGYHYDTIDPECRPVTKARFKELKDRLPKELAPKELSPTELGPKELKERLPKELGPKELSPKELGPKEVAPKEVGPKEIREVPEPPNFDPFIRPELRPDLSRAALAFEPDLNPDVAALRESLTLRRSDLR